MGAFKTSRNYSETQVSRLLLVRNWSLNFLDLLLYKTTVHLDCAKSIPSPKLNTYIYIVTTLVIAVPYLAKLKQKLTNKPDYVKTGELQQISNGMVKCLRFILAELGDISGKEKCQLPAHRFVQNTAMNKTFVQ